MSRSSDAVSDAAISAFVAEDVAPSAAAMARGDGHSPRDVVAAAARHGLAGLLVPQQYGGAGSGHLVFARAVEAVARVCASTSVIFDVHVSVATEPLVLFGNSEQQARYLPGLAAGELIGGFALTEPQSGSDAAALGARARRDGDAYVLDGTKCFITNAGAADLYIVMARTGDGSRGITAFLVEAASPGIRYGQPLHKLGLRGSWTGELVFEGVRVPAANRLGAEGSGFSIAMAALDSGRIGISAQAVGIAVGCLDACLVAARAGLPMDETALADIAARVAAARRLCHDAAAALDAGEPVTHLASVAKLYATDACMAAAHAAVELCAPESGLESHPAAIRFRDAKACQIYEGTNQIQRVVIARYITGK